MTKYDHRITISTHWSDVRQLLEHIRYSDSRIRQVTPTPDNLKATSFVVDLWYSGTAKGWKVMKTRAEAIGLTIEEGYKT